MISVLIIWLWILITTFCLGFGEVNILRRLCGLQDRADDSDRSFCNVGYSIGGLAVVTVYSQFFSLFSGVGAAAQAGLCLLSAVTAFFFRKEMAGWFAGAKKQAAEIFGDSALKKAAAVLGGLFLILLYAYGTSRGYIHTDTGLYHAQSIRWIEEYGAVPGLANLHNRLGYNSASFALTALYSFRFLGGQSFHVTAGYLALLTMAECLKVLRLLGRGCGEKAGPADFARLAGIFYLLTIFDEMISPASDYYMVCLTIYIFVRFLELAQKDEEDWFPYALLALLAVFNVTVKLSAAMLVLIVIRPAVRMIREKKIGPILIFIAAGVITAAPFLARNVVLTGYLLYPYPEIDLFNVPWKLSAGLAACDRREILVWGRGYTDVEMDAMPLSVWGPGWFKQLAAINKIAVLADIVSIPGFVIVFIVSAVLRRRELIRRYFLPSAVIAASLVFWFVSSPLIRYGCIFCYLTAVLFAALIWQLLPVGAAAVRRIQTVLLLLFIAYKAVSFGKEQAGRFENAYWILQQDYDNYPVIEYTIDGEKFYYAEDGGGTGYDAFPSAPRKADIIMRGEGLGDGFLPEQTE